MKQLVMVTMIAGCGSGLEDVGPDAAAETTMFEAHVIDSSGAPLAGAKVCAAACAISDASGAVVVPVQVGTSELALVASKDTFQTGVFLVSGGRMDQPIRLMSQIEYVLQYGSQPTSASGAIVISLLGDDGMTLRMRGPNGIQPLYTEPSGRPNEPLAAGVAGGQVVFGPLSPGTYELDGVNGAIPCAQTLDEVPLGGDWPSDDGATLRFAIVAGAVTFGSELFCPNHGAL